MPSASTNIEQLADFDIEWRRSQTTPTPGFTAVLRVRNEARNLPFVLPGLLHAVSRVIVIDNASTDGTPDVARTVAEQHGATGRLDVLSYPFAVSRCGSEHLHTPPNSVHSLTYFYNWSFSHVTTRYALKWDGDMVITDEGQQVIRDLVWQLEAADTIVRIPRHALYMASPDVAYLDVGWRNREPWAWPNKEGYTFGKGFEWEIPLQPRRIRSLTLPQFICFELKWLDSDEFDHWSPHEFHRSVRTRRKHREMAVFGELLRGRTPPDVLRVDSGGGDHVIDVVRKRSSRAWDDLIVGSSIAAPGIV